MIAIIISWIFIGILNKKISQPPDEVAFGQETVGSHAIGENGDIIHLENSLNDFDILKKDWVNRGENKIILLLGNSQYHTINQMKKGDIVVSQILYNFFLKYRYDFITSSLPNVNLQEQYLILEYFSKDLPINLLVLPVFMDDMREDGIRSNLSEYFKNDIRYDAKNNVVKKLNKIQINQGENSGTALYETTQEKVEIWINQTLNQYSVNWSKRGTLRSELFLKLYFMRNTIFGITPSSKRKKVIGPYNNNLDAYRLILDHCKNNNIDVLVYIPPIRNDVPIPYYKKEYEKFKLEIESIANLYSSKFFNFENIIPPSYWGSKKSTTLENNFELDFMHFQYAGHKILADTLSGYIKNIFLNNDI